MIHSSERATIDIEGGVRWERLTPTMLEELEFLELVYEPGAQSNPVPYTHAGIDMVVLLEGQLDAYIAFDHCHLEPGDSVMFPSSLPHRYVNPGRSTARGISVILMDHLWRGPGRDGTPGGGTGE